MEDGKIKTEEERMQEIEAVEANVKCMKDFTSPEQLYEELIRSIRKYHPSTDISMYGEPFSICRQVAIIFADTSRYIGLSSPNLDTARG